LELPALAETGSIMPVHNHDAKPAVPPVHHLRPLWVMPGIVFHWVDNNAENVIIEDYH
jgi:hypothetical protein